MAQRQKIIWLPGWFPSKTDELSGDFIERHAHAVSQYADLSIIFITKNTTIKKRYIIDVLREGNINYYKAYYSSNVIGVVNTFVSAFYYYYLLFKLYKIAVKQNGPFKYVHVCVALKQSLFALLLKYFAKKEIIISEHNSWFIKGDESFNNQHFVVKCFIKQVFKKASAVHVVSNELANALMSNKLIKSLPIVIPNVVNTKHFYFSNLYKQQDVFNFVTVIGDNYIKNTDGILRAFAKAKLLIENRIMLHIVGPNYNDMAVLTSQLKIENDLIFYGSVSNTEVASVMQKCDALIFFSRFETFGCVMAEGLCCGLPVIASNLAVLQENLTHGANALFVESEDEHALTIAIVKVATEKNLFDNVSISKGAVEKFNYGVVGKKIATLYK